MNPVSLKTTARGFALLAFGCWPSTVTPATQATELEKQQCNSGGAEQNEVQVLNNATVLRVTPLYGHVHTSPNTFESRINGAVVYVQPPKDLRPEQLTQIVQCHSARALLGEIDPNQIRNDPYWLPNAWLDIDVKPQPGSYAITISANSVKDGLQVLARAKAYAEMRVAANSVLGR